MFNLPQPCRVMPDHETMNQIEGRAERGGRAARIDREDGSESKFTLVHVVKKQSMRSSR